MGQRSLLNTYRRYPVTFVSGRGCTLVDDAGREYLDCLGGVACVPAGHGNEQVSDAIAKQAEALVHVSNYFSNQPMVELADRIRSLLGGWGRAFFCNSGAEANECAIKLVRKHAKQLGKVSERSHILCAKGSFHGRTLGALAATGQPGKWSGFEPIPSGFVHVEFNDLAAFDQLLDERAIGVLIEPILGEGGVIPATQEFLSGLRALCTEREVPLIFDEIQTGVGRTGSWWAFQRYGVKPDIVTIAKGIANGLPLGICVADEPFGGSFEPGDHGSTFGGNPVACRAALATIDCLAHGIVAEVNDKGSSLQSALCRVPHVVKVRGAGLMLGAILDKPVAAEVVSTALLKHQLVVNAVLPEVVRFLPPLTISREEIAGAVRRFETAVSEVYTDASLSSR